MVCRGTDNINNEQTLIKPPKNKSNSFFAIQINRTDRWRNYVDHEEKKTTVTLRIIMKLNWECPWTLAWVHFPLIIMIQSSNNNNIQLGSNLYHRHQSPHIIFNTKFSSIYDHYSKSRTITYNFLTTLLSQWKQTITKKRPHDNCHQIWTKKTTWKLIISMHDLNF